MNKIYDIIFIYGFSRLHPYLLNIIKYFNKEYRIGVCILNDIEKFTTPDGIKRIGKLYNTEKEFITLCKELGAEIIYLKNNNQYITDILFVPQAPFNNLGLEIMKSSIKSNKIIGIQGFGYGMQVLDDLFKIGCNKFLVYDKNIFLSVIESQNRRDLLDKFAIIEMGTPYTKYPIWTKEEFPEIDYLIALPSLLFIKDPRNKLNLIKNIYNLLKKIETQDKIVIKLHNVKDGGNRYIREVNFRSLYLAWFSEKFLGKKGVSLSTAIYYRNILDRAIPLEKITLYYNFGLELFLPYVKKGVITGISTVLWHCLYNKIPVYNCDSQLFGEHLPNYAGYKNFYIPFCNGELKFNENYYNKISDSLRNRDLIELIRQEIFDD